MLAGLAASMALGCGTPQRTAALECGAGGAGGAFLLCKAFGGSDDTCGAMAAVGGGIGAAACYNYADKLDTSRQELARHENTLDARLQYTDDLIAQTEALNAQMRERRQKLEEYTRDLQTRIARNQLTQDQLRQARSTLEQENRQAQDQLARAREALDENRRYQAQQERAFRDQQDEQDQTRQTHQVALLQQLEAKNARLEVAVRNAQSSVQQIAGLSALV